MHQAGPALAGPAFCTLPKLPAALAKCLQIQYDKGKENFPHAQREFEKERSFLCQKKRARGSKNS
jgi:hypothetical protein